MRLDVTAGVRMSRPWRSCHFPRSHRPSRETFLRRHLVIYSVQPFPSTPRYPLTNQSHPPPYPGENCHSQTRRSPSSLTRCYSLVQPTKAVLMSNHQRMVQPVPTLHSQTSQLWPNRRSLGVSKAPTVSAIPWTHAMLK